MNTLGIVMLSLFVGVFLVVLLGALGVCVWAALMVRKAVAAHTKSIMDIAQEMTAAATASRNAFSSIRQEMKTLLEGHQKIVMEVVKAINADALQAASVRSIEACKRIENAVATLNALVYAQEPAKENSLAPEATAPEGATIYGRSTGSRQEEDSDIETEDAFQS